MAQPDASNGTRRDGGRARWWLAGVVLAGLVAAALPAPQIRLAGAELRGLVGSYLYSAFTPAPPVDNLRVSDVYLSPKTIRLEWDYNTGVPVESYSVIRTSPAMSTTTQNKYYVDSFDFQYGTTYEYTVIVHPVDEGSPSQPPQGADPADVYWGWAASPAETVQVNVNKLAVTVNQTADSRYDLRYGNPTVLDHPFGSDTYRGGLFAGYGNDPSRVGRSYLRFALPSYASSSRFFCGSVNAYYTRSFANGNTEVGCQVVGDTWDASTLKWSTAPSMDPASATRTQVVAYDSQNPVSSWVHWSFTDDLLAALTGDGLFSVGLASKNEANNGWAYFAKKEWDSNYGACLLYAYEPNGIPAAPSNLTATTSGSSQINLGWTDNSSNEKRFRIERKIGSGSFAFLANTAAGATSFQNSGLSSGTTYSYRVRAERGDFGFSSWSNTATATTP